MEERYWKREVDKGKWERIGKKERKEDKKRENEDEKK